MTPRSFRAIASVLAALAAIGFGAELRAQEEEIVWTTHADPSFVNAVRYFDGRIWCATEGGILIFDPSDSSFTSVTTADGLPENLVRDVAVEANGRAWAAMENLGLVSFRLDPTPSSFRHFTGTNVVFDQMTSLDVEGDLLAYGTESGAGTFFNGLPGEQFINELPDSTVNAAAIDSIFIWFATDGGVALLLPDGSFRSVNAGLGDLHVNDILAAGGRKWAATNDGVYAFDPADSTWKSTGPLTTSERPARALAWGGGVLYLAGEQGVMENPTGGAWTFLDKAGLDAIQRGSTSIYNLGTSRVLSVATSPDGAVWCGTGNPLNERGANLSVFGGTTWKNLAPDAPLHNVFIAMSVGPDGSLWASHTQGRGLSYFRSGRGWNGYTEINSGGSSGLSLFGFQFCLLADRDGFLWSMALDNRLDRIEYRNLDTKADDVWTYFDLGEGTITSNRYVKGVEDPAGNRWFLSDGGIPTSTNEGIDILTADGLDWISIKTTGGNLAGRAVADAEIYPNGDVYLGIRSVGVQQWVTLGLDKTSLMNSLNRGWDPSTSLLVPATSLPNDKVTALEGSSDYLWIGTEGGLSGLSFRDGSLTTIRVKSSFDTPGLLSGVVRDLFLDARGNLWVATDAGLNVLWQEDPNRIDAFTTNLALRTKTSFNYPPSVVSPLVESTCLSLEGSPDGTVIYVGTRKGLSSLEFRRTTLVAPDLDAIYVYPNPVNAALNHRAVKIGNLDRPANIRIYNMEGELVHEQGVGRAGEEIWDLTTLNGFKARSGTYLVRILVDGAVTVRTLAVAK